MLKGTQFTAYLTTAKTMTAGKATRQVYLERRKHLEFDTKGYWKYALRYRQITQCYPAGTEFRPRYPCVTIIKSSCCKMKKRDWRVYSAKHCNWKYKFTLHHGQWQGCACDQQRLASEVVLPICSIINSTNAFISYDSLLQLLWTWNSNIKVGEQSSFAYKETSRYYDRVLFMYS
jgi:hypothetical protein